MKGGSGLGEEGTGRVDWKKTGQGTEEELEDSELKERKRRE